MNAKAIWLLALVLMLVFQSMSGSAQISANEPAISVRKGEHADYSRLVFDFPDVPHYQASLSDGVIQLRFSKAYAFTFGDLVQYPLKFIHDPKVISEDGTVTVELQVTGTGNLRHFLNGSSLVVDFLAEGPEAASSATAQAQPARPLPVQTAQNSAKAPQDMMVFTPTGDPGAVPVNLSVTADGVEMAFGWQRATTAAVFKRAGWLWAVFERKRPMDLSAVQAAIAQGQAGHISAVEQMDVQGFEVVRFQLRGDPGISVRRTGAIWRLRMAENETIPRRALEPERQRGDAGAVIFVTADDVGGRLRLSDPVIGDVLDILPLGDDGRGLAERNQYVDFDLLASAQGLVIKALSDDLEIVRFSTGVSIGARDGLAVSGPDLALKFEASAGGASAQTLLDLANWRKGPITDYTKNEQAMLLALSKANPAQRKALRWDLARFYTAHGAAPEAHAMLQLLKDTDPQIEQTMLWRAVSGVVLLDLGRPEQALKQFLDPDLDAESDIWLWRALAAEKAGRMEDALSYFRRGSEALVLHDRPFLTQIHLAMARAALDQQAYDVASGQIVTLQNMGLDGTAALATDYAYGKLVQRQGDIATARARFQDAATASDRRLSTQARLDLTKLEYAEGEISITEATERLERLRFAWRGDLLELDVLETLSSLYAEQGQFRLALETLQHAASAFSETPKARLLAARMTDIFSRLFLDGEADELPPLAALGLFYDFSELTPLGEPGDRMIRQLVARLVSVDLLDRAADLLEHQVSYRLEGSAQALVAAQLGKIYLLDGRPEETLRIMRATRQTVLPTDVMVQRSLVSSRALAELKRYEEATVLLEDISGREADELRADIFWASHDWPQLAAITSRLLGTRWQNEGALGLRERETLIRRALALSFTDDRMGLSQLRSRYQPLIKNGDYAGVFDLLTSPDGAPEGELSRIVGELGGVDQFRSFLSAYRAEFTPEISANAGGAGTGSGL